jgi:hypothetical protein
MNTPRPWPQVLVFFGESLIIEPSPETWPGDGALLLVCQSDKCL